MVNVGVSLETVSWFLLVSVCALISGVSFTGFISQCSPLHYSLWYYFLRWLPPKYVSGFLLVSLCTLFGLISICSPVLYSLGNHLLLGLSS